jgi:tetratricopeptide (TPR) repeat protein
MMRSLAAPALVFAAACTPLAEQPHTPAQWSACIGDAFVASRAGACSAVIADRTADADRRTTALLQRATIRSESGQHARAIADYGRALRIDPYSIDALVGRGNVHAQRGAYDVALRDFDAALILSPHDPGAMRGRELALQGRIDAVGAEIAMITEALIRRPRDAGLLNNRCWVRAVAGRELELALADCNAALTIEPNSANTLDSRALVHLKRGSLAEALTDYEAALAIEPGDGHYLYGRGLVRRALGQNASAEEDFIAAERAQPGVAEMYRSYGL